MQKISVVVPCYNEEPVLELLYSRLSSELGKWDEEVEVILVDDGSVDGTWRIISEIHERDTGWKGVRLSRNFGHQTAVSAGLNYASGDAVVVMDADLQDPPEVLRRFVEKWREGYEVVYAVRRKRKESALKRFLYRSFYKILSLLTNSQIPEDSGDFCLMDRRVAELVRKMPEHNRFVRGLRAWVGFRQVGVEYERDSRQGGEPQYTFSKLVKLAVDGILSFSFAPLRMVTWLGLSVSIVAFLGAVFTLIQRIFAEQFARIGLAPVPGFATIVISLLFLGGVQLVCLGIIGEYIGRIYDEVKNRPLWIEMEKLGLAGNEEEN